ncbi:MAG: pyridoxal-phosphate dependent enzyme, partial [Woeseiaceae bacterium]
LGDALRFHQQNETEIIRFGGARPKRIRTLRQHLQGRHAWAIPMGGSSWVGTLGYVNAGLELSAQIDAAELEAPERIYVALGTMGTVAGLAVGLALAERAVEIQAVRVTAEQISNECALHRLMHKTASMMHAVDPSVMSDIAARTNVIIRHEFLGGGYGHETDEAEKAIAIARDEFGLELDMTYTAKAMAAVLHDLDTGYDRPVLFWNTFSSRPMHIDRELEPDYSRVPDEFARYF